MGVKTHPRFGLAARDLRKMRGRDTGSAGMDALKRVRELERTISYMVQIPREIVIQTGERFTPVPFDKTGRLYLYSSDELVGVDRSPHARQHVIDLTLDTAAICAAVLECIKAGLVADTDWLDVVCGYDCESGIPPDPWPGGG